jgi:hypothetical protein
MSTFEVRMYVKPTGGSTETKVEWLTGWLVVWPLLLLLLLLRFLRFRRLRYVCVFKPTGRSTERIWNGRELKLGSRNERKHP